MAGKLTRAAHARRIAIVLGVVVLAVAVLAASRNDLVSFADQTASTPPPPNPSDPIIDNGSFVQMGINPEGHLNVAGGTLSMPIGSTTDVGLRYIPTNGESTAPGCLCEGWGVANADGPTGTFAGYANIAIDGVIGLTVQPGTGITNPTGQIKPESVGSAFRSVVSAGAGRVRVTHDYKPSTSPNLYEADVTIENIGIGTIGDLRYRRVMDWDIAPFTFEEYVEIHVGTAANLVVATTDGFRSGNPLSSPGPTSGAPPTTLVSGSPDYFAGPSDQGALFDFSFGSLAPGASRTFTIFYGAAADRSSALTAIASVGGEVYSLGLPRELTGEAATDGPHAFIFAFKGVGGTPLPTPTPCAPEGCPTATSTRTSTITPTPTVTETPTETFTPTSTSPPPVKGNDNFASAVVVPGPLPYSNKEDNAGATREIDEPQPCAGISRTVWYRYTSPTNQMLQADTTGSDFDTALAVYSGTALNALTLIACDDDSGPGLTSLITFFATAGTTYYFQPGSFFSSFNSSLVFNLAPGPTPTPTPTVTLTPTSTRTATPCPTAKVPILPTATLPGGTPGGGCGTPTPTRTPTRTATPCPTTKVPIQFGSGCGTPTRTPTPASGLDFSIGIDTNGNGVDDCQTRPAGPTKCSLPTGAIFRLKVYLNSLPTGYTGYRNFDIRVDYSGVSSQNNATASEWPDCTFLATFYSPGRVLWGCAYGPGGPGSSYTGLIGTTGFICAASGTLVLVHGVNATDMGDADIVFAESGSESLTINCLAATTGTPTRTPGPLGGVADYPNVDRTGGAPMLLIALAAIAAGLLMLGGGARYALRRRG